MCNKNTIIYTNIIYKTYFFPAFFFLTTFTSSVITFTLFSSVFSAPSVCVFAGICGSVRDSLSNATECSSNTVSVSLPRSLSEHPDSESAESSPPSLSSIILTRFFLLIIENNSSSESLFSTLVSPCS